ncbi:helix-turn-helix domain-containing protein [Rhodohalobacter sp. SW132]|uniref:helix-turn-helix domain-containing protein n=1 Tax=Rhodohalobacter sp. SW132 TaxID=2293433 RepID=UPI0013140A3D|nr:helix-turn-helix domain-containing protein [Rhodohalobacter sp. SW132]
MKKAYFNPYRLFHGVFIPDWLLNCESCPSKAKLLYGYLAKRAGKSGDCFPGQKDIAMNLNCSTRHVRTLLDKLVELDLIEIKRVGLNKNNEYRFIFNEEIIPANSFRSEPFISTSNENVDGNTDDKDNSKGGGNKPGKGKKEGDKEDEYPSITYCSEGVTVSKATNNQRNELSCPDETDSSGQEAEVQSGHEKGKLSDPIYKPRPYKKSPPLNTNDTASKHQKHTDNQYSSGDAHTPTASGGGELVSSLRNTMQVLCNLRRDQVDSVCSWLKDNPDKLKSFNQWFYKNITLKFFDDNFVIRTSAGFSWAELKKVLEDEITIPRDDDSKNEVDLFYRLKYKELEPDTEGLKQISGLLKNRDLRKYAIQRAGQ